jgi:hypothetical protein
MDLESYRRHVIGIRPREPLTARASVSPPPKAHALRLLAAAPATMSQYGTQTQTQKDKENVFSFAGNIEKLSLTNFMCHASLEIDFCAGVNFVIGENGSGKSAILTALCVALVRVRSVTDVTEAPAEARAACAVAPQR